MGPMTELTKVAGWPSDHGGCGWYRIETPVKGLGIEDTIIDTVLPNSIVDEPERLVVLNRSTTPVAMMLLESFQRDRRPWVYDIDDLLWMLTPDNPAYKYYSDDTVMGRLQWHIRNAPIVTVSTKQLADEVHAAGRTTEIAVVPNTLPDSLYDTPQPLSLPTGQKTILWRGSNTHAKDVEVVGYGLRKIDATRPDVRIVFAGVDHRKQLKLENAEFLPWVRDPEEYVRQIIELAPDIALCPLGHTRFNKSKSHVNALEASIARAVPIASRTPAYEDFIDDGVNGLLVPYTTEHWYRAILRLLDTDLTDMKEAARKNAEHYRTGLMRDEYRALLETL